MDFGEPIQLENASQGGLDPFDKYLSDLASKRGLGSADIPDLQDRGPFQSPIQKVPLERPFQSPQPQESLPNPFDAFFTEEAASSEKEVGIQIESLNACLLYFVFILLNRRKKQLCTHIYRLNFVKFEVNLREN